MDKNAIKKYAVWARNELIARVSQRAQRYGITKDQIIEANADSVNGIILTDTEKKQRQALIQKIREKGYEQVMEEVAYTWFNRFSALRFMEVNGYLPSHVRVFTDQNNVFKPEIMSEAIHLDLDGLDMEKVYALKEANNDDELFKYLIITQCNDLSKILPGMFQKIADYTELLFPDNLLREGSVIEQMITLIPEVDWKDQVQIIGWLYQYYNSEPKDQVFADLKKNKKITKEKIPAATQLFTPDWIVRYMVENSLGRLWVEGHPNNDMRSQWKYYLDEAEQEPDVQKQLTEIRKEYSALKPEEIKCIDPCCGSGHILAYMFDILVQIYGSYGISAREAATSIVKYNIYGLDIDERAAQLAYFSVVMKARQYDRRFFSRNAQPNVYAIRESNDVYKDALKYFINDDSYLQKAMNTLVEEMHDAKEYGSILNVSKVDFDALFKRFDECKTEISMYRTVVEQELYPFVKVAQTLAQKYHAVVTNPPYMAIANGGAKLNKYIKDNYSTARVDLYSVFVERCMKMLCNNGFEAMITMHGWMFLSSFEKLRSLMMKKDIVSLVHLGARAFEEISGEVVQTCSFVIANNNSNYNGRYVRLVDYGPKEKEEEFFNARNYHQAKKDLFNMMPGNTLAYWISPRMRELFSFPNIDSIGTTRHGMTTGNNDRFLRLWHEVDINKIGFGLANTEEAAMSGKKWFPYNKGGYYRKWYGNNEYVVNYENDGVEMKEFTSHLPQGTWVRVMSREYYFLPALTWTKTSTKTFGVRYSMQGAIFDVAGSCLFPYKKENYFYVLGLLNTKIAFDYLKMLNPTLSIQTGDIKNLPYIEKNVEEVSAIVREAISISKQDWDSFEISWDYDRHPLVRIAQTSNTHSIKDSYNLWDKESNERFEQLKCLEEKLNQQFISIYGLENEMDSKISDNDVTVRKADLSRDIRDFISYAVGCMLGRYSLDENGIAFAGGIWDSSKYRTFPVDKDGILPISDDEYFEDDITNLFVKFIEIVFGKDTLEENLKFVADALGGKGNSREIIRNYFLNSFFSDHLKKYQKRPFYWLFDSGKKNSFKCLVYMHRYQPDTIARIRTDYVHEQQSRYRTAIADLEQRIESASTSDRVKLSKKLKHLQEQSAEIHDYEEKIHHLADQYISIDLDDGVKANYAKFQDVLAKIK